MHKYIYAQYIWAGKGAAAIIRQIEKDETLKQRFGGVPSSATLTYHTKQILEDLENSVDFDAMDKFVGEYLRYQQSMDAEVADVEDMIDLIDKQEKPELWLSMKRFKKDLIDSRMKALADHELPLAVKKMKKERTLKKVEFAQIPQDPKELT